MSRYGKCTSAKIHGNFSIKKINWLCHLKLTLNKMLGHLNYHVPPPPKYQTLSCYLYSTKTHKSVREMTRQRCPNRNYNQEYKLSGLTCTRVGPKF